jgi:hypothetical protein
MGAPPLTFVWRLHKSRHQNIRRIFMPVMRPRATDMQMSLVTARQLFASFVTFVL